MAARVVPGRLQLRSGGLISTSRRRSRRVPGPGRPVAASSKPPLPICAAWPRVLSQQVLLPPGLRGPRSWGRWGLDGHGAQCGDPTACVVLSAPEMAARLTGWPADVPSLGAVSVSLGSAGVSAAGLLRAFPQLTRGVRQVPRSPPAPALGLSAALPGLPVARPAGRRCGSGVSTARSPLGQGLESASQLSCPSLGPRSPVCPPPTLVGWAEPSSSPHRRPEEGRGHKGSLPCLSVISEVASGSPRTLVCAWGDGLGSRGRGTGFALQLGPERSASGGRASSGVARGSEHRAPAYPL